MRRRPYIMRFLPMSVQARGMLVLGLIALVVWRLMASGMSEFQNRTLTLYIWSDYISPKVIEEFERREQCRVKVVTFANNEELKGRIQSGLQTADIIVPSSYELQNLQTYLKDIDPKRLTNFKRIDWELLADLGVSFDEWGRKGVPYLISPTGLAVSRKELPHLKGVTVLEDGMLSASWRMIGEHAPLSMMLDDPRETIAAALLATGSEADARDDASLDRAMALLKQWCEAGVRLNGSVYHYLLKVNSLKLAHAYLGDVLPLDEDIAFVIPDEGFVISCDALAIPKHSRNEELAYRFIDYLYEVDVSVQNMKWTRYRTLNKEAFTKAYASGEHPALAFLESDWREKGRILRPLSDQEELAFKRRWSDLEEYLDD